MEMPDKIYLNKYMIRKGMMYPAEPPYDVLEEEYIRKDALLEWAKANLQDRDDWNEKSAADAFCEMIDKLNSM